MAEETAEQKEKRLAEARRFLAAGRTAIHDAVERPRPEPRADGTKDPVAERADPTRFGDWERKGRCIDF